MKLGIMSGTFSSKIKVDIEMIRLAESLGYDSVWSAEAYGNDAVTVATWIAAQTEKINVGTAIMQMPARTPAMAAMTAMTLSQLSGGRFIMGLGPSGPQVAEGFHGVPYGKPLTRTREYISIVRKIMAREAPLEHHGEHYDIPVTGEGTTNLGKPLKSILAANTDIKIYTASISPNGLRCAAEVADGVFPLWMNPERFDTLQKPYLDEGFAKAGGGKGLDDFDVCPSVGVIVTDDVEKGRMPMKMQLALYIGGMGARNKNFYNDYAKRLGYEEAAVQIQDLYLDGKKQEAVAAVPDELVDDLNLIGPADRIRDRLSAWRDAGKRRAVDSILIGSNQPEALRLMAEELL
jgi:F420-dependent oxidoreductase-like protein